MIHSDVLLGITVDSNRAPAVFTKSKSEDPVDQQLADDPHAVDRILLQHPL
jgi:hypothetical protein